MQLHYCIQIHIHLQALFSANRSCNASCIHGFKLSTKLEGTHRVLHSYDIADQPRAPPFLPALLAVSGYSHAVTGYDAVVTVHKPAVTGYGSAVTGYSPAVTGYHSVVTGLEPGYGMAVTDYNSVTGYHSSETGYGPPVTGYHSAVTCYGPPVPGYC